MKPLITALVTAGAFALGSVLFFPVRNVPPTVQLPWQEDIAQQNCEKGHEASQRKEYHRAIAYYTESLRLRPDNVSTLIGRCNARMSVDDFTGAEEDANTLIAHTAKHNVAHNGLKLIAYAYSLRSLARFAQNRAIEARNDASAAIHISPESPFCYFLRAKAYFKLDQLNQAIADISTAIRLNPQDAAYYEFRATCHDVNLNFLAGYADWTRAIDISNDAKHYLDRAKCLFMMEQWRFAIKDAEKAATMGNKDAHGLLETLYSAIGDNRAAYYHARIAAQAGSR